MPESEDFTTQVIRKAIRDIDRDLATLIANLAETKESAIHFQAQIDDYTAKRDTLLATIAKLYTPI